MTVTLRLARGAGGVLPRLDSEALEAAIAAALAAARRPARLGLDLAPMTAADLLGVRGVSRPAVRRRRTRRRCSRPGRGGRAAGRGARRARLEEGRALGGVLAAQVDRIEELARAARATAEARAGRSGALLRARLEAVLARRVPVDEARLAQELALIAVRADVTEELDRLDAHVAAARELIAADGAGRAAARLPDAGVQPRGQHALLEGAARAT